MYYDFFSATIFSLRYLPGSSCVKEGSKSHSKREGRLHASRTKLLSAFLWDLWARLFGSSWGNPAQWNKVNIHDPEESSSEIAFAPKQAQDYQLWRILKDDPPGSSAWKQNIFSNLDTADMTMQKVIEVCQRYKSLYLSIPFPHLLATMAELYITHQSGKVTLFCTITA